MRDQGLQLATFELVLGEPLPDILGLASAAGLAQLKYNRVPTTLIRDARRV